MNVLSLFDGMSCGQIALNRAGIEYDKYFACEIDKHAIKVTQANYPDTIQLGDVTKVKAEDLPKIDLLIGGSPCQGFSFAGRQLAFDDPRSFLFFEYVRLLKELKPKYFLLENVRMKKEHELVISKYLGIDPIEINSSLVSAQNRVRLYWTNIGSEPFGLFGDLECKIPQPKDKGIVLKDILETEVDEKYYLKNPKLDFSGLDLNGKGNALRTTGHGSQDRHNFDLICVGAIQFGRSEEGKKQRKKSMANGKDHTPFQAKEVTGLNFEKMNTITSSQTKYNLICYQFNNQVTVRKNEVDIPSLKALLKKHRKPIKEICSAIGCGKTQAEHWFRSDQFFAIPDAEIWLALKEFLEIQTDEFDNSIMEFETKDGVFDQSNRVYDVEGKNPTLLAGKMDNLVYTKNYLQYDISGKGYKSQQDRAFYEDGKHGCLAAARSDNKTGVINNGRIRRLTPIECEKLQTVPGNYTAHVSDSQRYRMLGNGWTVDVIAHILGYMDK